MQTQEVTYHAKLVAKTDDGMGYITYVFENLEYVNYDHRFIMCVKFPNWNNNIIDIDDVGYVAVRYVREGIDQWYNGNELIKYKDTNIIFLKFIPEKPKTDVNMITID